VIGVRPLLGGFSDADFVEDARVRPVILMYDAWQARFAGSDDAIGRVVLINEIDRYGFRIVGVMPKEFTFPTAVADISFLAPSVSSNETRTDPKRRRLYEVVARLPPGLSAEQFATRLEPGIAATAAQFPPQGPRPKGWSEKSWRAEGPYDAVTVTPLGASLAQKSRSMFLTAFVAVIVLVLIAAANISSLMTARVWERAREFQMRRALGASPLRLARLWMVEAVLLVGAGGAIGVAAAMPLLTLILPLLPDEVVLLKPARLDHRVGLFVLLTLAGLSALVSLAPMVRSLRLRAPGALTGAVSHRFRTSGRFAVLSGQVAAAFVLTVLGACLVGSVMSVYANRFPFETSAIVVLEGRVHGPGGRMGQSDERAVRGRTIQDRLRHVPGVSGATLVAAQLLRGGGWQSPFLAPPGAPRVVNLDMWAVTEGFFDVVGLRPIEGRLPTTEELKAGAPVLVLSERVARAYWPGKPAAGQTLIDGSKAAYAVIGVVPDVRWFAWDMESAIVYGPYTPLSRSPLFTFFLRTNGRTAPVIAEGLRVMREVDPLVRPYTAAPLNTMVNDSIALRRFQSWLFGGFAGAALAVMGVGILGLLAMATARRTREIGIRCALGATSAGVGRLIVREQLTAVVAGLALGGLVAAWAVGFVKSYLYQLSVTDPRIWVAALVAVIGTAALGTIVPAWRASHVDPLQALRTE
jgi:predicted permease